MKHAITISREFGSAQVKETAGSAKHFDRMKRQESWLGGEKCFFFI